MRVRRDRLPLRCAGVLGIALLAGCAAAPPPLPPVAPEALPGAWIDLIAAEPPPPPFESRLRIRVEVPGQPAGSLDGVLRVACPDTLALSARLGAFKPVFALASDADSAALWLHDAGQYGVAPRTRPDWERLDPAAWAAAITWLICPAGLVRSLEPDGPGTIDARAWKISGRVAGAPWRFHLQIDLKARALSAVTIEDSLGPRVTLRASRWQLWRGRWVAEDLQIRSPRDGLSLEVSRLTIGPWDRARRTLPPRGRPAGWSILRPDESDLSFP